MTQRVAKGFNQLAPVYSFLSRLVFGKELEYAQFYFLNTIQSTDTVLIIGGGSGTLLKTLLKLRPQISLTYIDISPKMIALSKARISKLSNVNFITGTEQNIPDQIYPIVITNFYLDLFTDEKLAHVIQTIKNSLAPGAHWLVTDFVQERRWHSVMLWIMYRFFKITTGIEAVKLPHWQSTLEKAGFSEIKSKRFYWGFIKTAMYKSLIKA